MALLLRNAIFSLTWAPVDRHQNKTICCAWPINRQEKRAARPSGLFTGSGPSPSQVSRAIRPGVSFQRRAPATAIVSAIAAGSQHKTISRINHRTVVSGSVPAMTARYRIGPVAASMRSRSAVWAERCACNPTRRLLDALLAEALEPTAEALRAAE